MLDGHRTLSAEGLELRGTLAYLLGDSRGYFEDFAAAHRAHERPDLAARSAVWLGIMHLIRGEAGHSRGWFATARRLVDEHGECAASAYLRVSPILGDTSASREEAIATAREVNAIARRYDDADAVALTGQTLGQLLIRTGSADEGRDLMDEAMVSAVSGQLSTPLVEVLVLLAVMESCQLLADVQRAREWASTVSRLRTRYPELAIFPGVFALDRARLALLSGDWDSLLEAAMEVDEPLQGEAWRLRAEVLLARGQLREAQNACDQAAARGMDPVAVHALLHHAEGRTPAAAAEIRRALSTLSDSCDRAPLIPAAVAILAQIEIDEAEALAGELAEIAQRFRSSLLTARANLSRAEVALQQGDQDVALTEARRAVAGFTALEIPAELVQARTIAAAVHDARGEIDAAAVERSAAAAIGGRLGMPQATAPARPDVVSARELDVLRLLAGGATNREIAEALTLSPRTVDRHVSNIFLKLDVTTRAAAAAYAVEQGLA